MKEAIEKIRAWFREQEGRGYYFFISTADQNVEYDPEEWLGEIFGDDAK